MKRFTQHEPFNIYRFEASEWPYPLHNHSYFEIIFIHGGRGVHVINEHRFDYQEGDVFLLGPRDHHIFEIATTTQFCYLRFTESFFQGDPKEGVERNWQETMEQLLRTPYQACGSLVKDIGEKKRLDCLLAVLIDEYDNRHNRFAATIMAHLMRSILSILARNTSQQTARPPGSRDNSHALEAILAYIRQHIYDPEKLRMEQLAAHFHYSPNYLSIYFKRQTGESLQQYILRYKLKLVETRLLYSNWSISQIAFELKFSDESHLSKLFRKYYGLAPGDFRRSNRKGLTDPEMPG